MASANSFRFSFRYPSLLIMIPRIALQNGYADVETANLRNKRCAIYDHLQSSPPTNDSTNLGRPPTVLLSAMPYKAPQSYGELE